MKFRLVSYLTSSYRTNHTSREIGKHGKRSRGRPLKKWLPCVLEDAALITGVENITIDAAEQQSMDKVQWRGNVIRNKEFLRGADHSQDLSKYKYLVIL